MIRVITVFALLLAGAEGLAAEKITKDTFALS
jgi:hypothetical protein